MNGWESILPFVLIVVVFWFLVLRPARNQQKRLASTQSSVELGSEVMLGSGIYGRIAAIHDDTFEVEIAPGTIMKVAKQAIVRVIEPSDADSSDHADGAGSPAVPTDDTTAPDQDR